MALKEKPFTQAVTERRATQSFDSTPIPEADLREILRLGLEAPSGYNLQPWRFVVVRDPEQRKRLRAAAFGQPKVEEAPVVIVACGDPDAWRGEKGDLEKMISLAKEKGTINDDVAKVIRTNVANFLGGTPADAAGIGPDFGIWANRHTMIAFTTLMWAAESLGYDTAPMEGFVESQVKQVLGIPERVRVVALLAIGKRKGEDKPYGGRFPIDYVAFDNTWGKGLKL
ncbi:MAG TPA: nitroreductase family protein [candidate division Zixibacteria bacterium]|nr:nitroreductase family protein [candidate division Zixibacteria bacterium]